MPQGLVGIALVFRIAYLNRTTDLTKYPFLTFSIIPISLYDDKAELFHTFTDMLYMHVLFP